MSVIVRDDGFHADDLRGAAVPVAPDTPPAALPALLAGVGPGGAVAVLFPAFGDGRGFGLARRIRALGYGGRLRACGPLIADQYAMARRAGFDEIEIPDDLAARQPEAQWRARADWRAFDYQARMRGQNFLSTLSIAAYEGPERT